MIKEGTYGEDLAREAPLLSSLPKSDPFLVEPGFFERFPHEVQALASKPARAYWPLWIRRAAMALPAAALVLFTLHSLRPEAGQPTDGLPDENELIYSLSGQLSTDEILDGATAEEWPEFGTVTIELTPEEALAYVDHNQIDLNDYLQ